MSSASKYPEAVRSASAFNDQTTWSEIMGYILNNMDKSIRGLELLSSSTEDEFIVVGFGVNEVNLRLKEIISSEEDVFVDIGEIMMSIQFHDITRQIFERSLGRLRSLREKITRRIGINWGESDYDQARIFYAEIAGACHEESMLVLSAQEKFISAVAASFEKLHAIEEKVGNSSASALAVEIKNIIRQIRVHGFVDTVAGEVIADLEAIADFLNVMLSGSEVRPATCKERLAGTSRAKRREKQNNRKGKQGLNCIGDNIEFF